MQPEKAFGADVVFVRFRRAFVAVVTVTTAIFGAFGVAEATPAIRITATHFSGAIMSGEGDISRFVITIAPEGKASISTVTEVHGRKKHATRTLNLTAGQLDSIVAATTKNGFFDLPHDMERSAEDSPAYILDIAIGRQHRRVGVHAPAFYADKAVLRRFRRVWAAVSRAVGFTRNSALHHLTVNS